MFGEVGYKLITADAVIEPFAGLAYVKLDTDGFRESGGAASLPTDGGSTNAAYSTLGVRADTDVAFGSETVRLSGSVAWQHAFVHDVPEATLRFDGGNGFTVGGVPLAGDAALVQAGISTDVMENAAIGLTYGGQFGDGTTRHDARLDLSVRF